MSCQCTVTYRCDMCSMRDESRNWEEELVEVICDVKDQRAEKELQFRDIEVNTILDESRLWPHHVLRFADMMHMQKRGYGYIKRLGDVNVYIDMRRELIFTRVAGPRSEDKLWYDRHVSVGGFLL